MRLRVFIDLEYAEPVTKQGEDQIRDTVAGMVHGIARSEGFNTQKHKVVTMAVGCVTIPAAQDGAEEDGRCESTTTGET